MSKLTPEERIQKAHVAIMRHPKWAAFSGLVATGPVEVTTAIPTACTDGWGVKYNPDFVKSLSDTELRFLVLHENAGHKAFRHLRTWQHLWRENAQLANIAADHFVNLSLVDTDAGEGFITMPKVGVQPEPRYRGWSVQMIYEDLKQDPPPRGDRGGSGDGEGTSDEGAGLDSHDWEGASKLTEQEQDARAQEIGRALRQGESVARKLRGRGKGGSSMLIDELLHPQVNWVEQLREFVTENCRGYDESTWSRVRRRFIADDIYMPGSESMQLGPLVVGFDTSGSVFTSGTVSRFASELASIIELTKPESVRVVYWDYGIQGEQVFEDGQFALASLRPRGGGGTDGSVLFTHLRDKRIKPSAIVMFTDGEVGDWGTSDVPTLWAITNKSIRAPWGTTIHINI